MKSNAIFQTDSTDDCINLKGKRKKRLKISITDPVLFTISFGLHTAKQDHNSSPQMEFWFSPGEVLLPYLNTPSLTQCHRFLVWAVSQQLLNACIWQRCEPVNEVGGDLPPTSYQRPEMASFCILTFASSSQERDAISLFPTNAKCNWHV